MDINNNENNLEDIKIEKKNAELNFLQRIHKKFGFVLPILIFLFVIMLFITTVFYFLKVSEKNEIIKKKEMLIQEINEYNDIKDVITQYSSMKVAYNKYRQNLINFPLIFNTIQKYIPKGMDRKQLKIVKASNKNKVSVTLTGEISGYNNYMALLNLIDKCEFTDEKVRKGLLNVGKIELGGEKGDENLASKVNINYRFDFSTVKNKYLLQKTFELAQKDFETLGQLHYYSNVVLGNNSDKWRSDIAYNKNIKKIVEKKKQMVREISKIKDTDINGYFKAESGNNFIANMKKENKLLDYFDNYWDSHLKQLEKNYNKINNNGVITYISKKEKKKQLEKGIKEENIKGLKVLDIKEKLEKKILEIYNRKMEIYLLKKYNEYLLDSNYLNTFTEILKDKSIKYKVIKNGKEEELSGDDYIVYLIDKSILSEDTPLLEKFVQFVDDSKKDDERKKIYTKYVGQVKQIDIKKTQISNSGVYIDNFFKDYYRFKLFEEIDYVFNYFITKTNYNQDFLQSIPYSFLNFGYKNDLFSFKNRYVLTLKNNTKLLNDVKKLQNMKGFENLMKKLEDFIDETEDMIKFNNNNIDCIVQDTKADTKNIYEGILENKINEADIATKVNELNIIIKSID